MGNVNSGRHKKRFDQAWDEFSKTTDGVKLKFGKYKDQLLAECDDKYLIWLVKQHAETKNFSEKFILEVESELKSRGFKIEDLID